MRMLLFVFVQTFQGKTSVELITANIFGGIIHDALTLGLASLVPTL